MPLNSWWYSRAECYTGARIYFSEWLSTLLDSGLSIYFLQPGQANHLFPVITAKRMFSLFELAALRSK